MRSSTPPGEPIEQPLGWDSHLVALFMQAPSAIAIVQGPRQVFIFANPRYQALFGRTHEELIGRSIREVWPEVEGQGIYELFEQVYRTGEPYTAHEYEARFMDGDTPKTGYFQFVAQPIKSAQGTVTEIMIQVTDVTEQVVARQKLKQSEERFMAAISAVPGILWTNNARGEMEGPQPGWEALTGQSLEEYQGYGWAKAVHPDDAAPTIDAWNEAVRERKPFLFEHRVRQQNGQWAQFSIRAIPVLSDDGSIREWVGVHTNVTQQRLAEAALRESENRFRIMADAAPNMVWCINPDGTPKYVNPQVLEYFGMTEEAFFRALDTDLLHPDDVERVRATLIPTMMQRLPYSIEHRFRRHDGQYRWFLAKGAPSLYPNGELYGYVGTCFDIHEQKLFAEKLEQEVADRTKELVKVNRAMKRSNEYMQQFAYVASHDLQEPLRKIQSFSSMIAEEYAPAMPEPALDLFERIQSAAGRMSVLIKDLLAYSRLTTQLQPFELISLEAVVAGAIYDQELAFRELDAQLEVQALPSIMADPTQMHQLFGNLISNALKYVRPGIQPVITIASRSVPAQDALVRNLSENPQRTYWEISIRDNGIGFEEQYLDKLFQMFGRLHSRDKYEGTGIGLAICKRVVENHHGSITATSEPGQGSSFYIYLPT